MEATRCPFVHSSMSQAFVALETGAFSCTHGVADRIGGTCLTDRHMRCLGGSHCCLTTS